MPGSFMKRAFAVVALASLAFLSTVGAADSDPDAAATAASREWLSVVDAGQYGQSWDEAAELFKHNISKSQWERAVGDVRKQTGALKTRELESAKPAHQLPGVPDGDYVVIVYRSSFAEAPVATETVTPMRDADGHWRVAGYYVK
jgi:opacity protein-like surface antigen